MAIIVNKTKHNVRFVAYRADGEFMHQDNGIIPPGDSRLVKGDYVGDIDWFIIAAYIPESKVPHHFNKPGMEFMKDAHPLAYSKIGLDEKFVLLEDDTKKEYSIVESEDEPEGSIHGW